MKSELHCHGVNTDGKRKPELEKIFRELRMGISNFPAILRSNPEMSLESINAQMYEVAATEPLHDIKGHNANLLEYTLPLLFGNMKMECEKIIATVLGKDTKCCCDYRKALLLSNAKNVVDGDLVELFSTAAEIQELLYAKGIKQNDMNIL